MKEKVDAYTMIASHVVLISNSLQERAKKFRNSMIGIRAISPTSLLGASKDVKEYRATVAYMISCKFIFSDTLEQYIDEFEEFSELKTLMVNVWKLAIEDTYSLFGKHLSDDVEKIVDKCKKNIHKYTSSTETASDEQLSENNTSTNIISSNINEQNENITITKADTFFGPLSLILGVILTILVILVSKEKSVIGIFGVVPLIFGIITRKKSLYNKDKAIIGIVLGLATIIIGFIKFLTIF